ncbi:hypothetical protein [Mycoplasmopsis columboralis]|uniref:Lipoprotein n=1 Tax=Mycoplasmopsis columboralis TaxID=171282 RepID=A0A449B647_9BACT|nr:hypothetical protein [Mycoplasmopsis columboralis]VEU76081.1 Uncharacterised protein [Mycoplasmopsis columboralis]
MKLKKLFLLSSTLLAPAFVAAQCSPTAQTKPDKPNVDKPESNTENNPTTPSAENQNNPENTAENTSPSNNTGTNTNTDTATSTPTQEGSSDSSSDSATPAQEDKPGTFSVEAIDANTTYGRVEWSSDVTKEDFLKELNKVSLEYNERAESTEQLAILRRFYISDSHKNWNPTSDNLAVRLRVRRFVRSTDENGRTVRRAVPTIVNVPLKYIDNNPENDGLSVSQKSGKSALLALRERVIKGIFKLVNSATPGVSPYYDLDARLVNDFTIYGTMFLSVSTLILTIDYLLDNQIYSSRLASLLRGQLVKDSNGQPSDDATERFFRISFSTYPTNDDLRPYSFAFTYTFLVKRNAELIQRASRSN